MRTMPQTSSGTQNNAVSSKNETWGKALIRFSIAILILSSLVKFWHPPKVVEYMGSMGYEGGTFFFVAALELFCAVLFLLPATRPLGLLLVSSYLGVAIASHVAFHRTTVGGPFLTFMATHRYVGALEPAFVLALAWLGAWLQHPDLFAALARSKRSGNGILLRHEGQVPLGSNS